MFGTPIDAWYVWLGLALVSGTLLGVALSFPTTAPPDAPAVADLVDSTVAHPHPATAERQLAAAEVKLGPHRIALRNDGGTSRATFVYGPVTPVREGTVLWELVQGAAPQHVFDSKSELLDAADDARQRPVDWRPADDTLTIRTISWEGVDVTLVDA